MANSNLLRDAIADAKAVRESALANAKAALEEAFTPKLEEMLSDQIDQLGEETHDDDMDYDSHDEEDEVDESVTEDDTDGTADASEDDEDEEVVENISQDEEEEEDEDEGSLDLESIIKELEGDIESEEEYDSTEDDGDHLGETYSDGSEAGDAYESDQGEVTADDLDEDVEFDLDALLREMEEEDDVDLDDQEDAGVVKDLKSENASLRSDIAEHRDVIQELRDRLNEINLLNAKLLFTNRLFKEYNLSNDQKMKVIETLDRSTTLREVKLVYSTLAESLSDNFRTVKKGPTRIDEVASRQMNSTRPIGPRTSVTEASGTEMADRFRTLANIKDTNKVDED